MLFDRELGKLCQSLLKRNTTSVHDTLDGRRSLQNKLEARIAVMLGRRWRIFYDSKIRAKGRVFMRTYVAAVLISMALISPAMALSSSPIMSPRPTICDIGRPTTANRALPGNEIVRPGTRIDFRQIVIRIVL